MPPLKAKRKNPAVLAFKGCDSTEFIYVYGRETQEN